MLVHTAKQAMVALATFIPSATYSAGTMTVTWAQINSALTAAGVTTVTATDSVERLIFALLSLLAAKQVNGTLSQPTCGCEVSQQGITNNSVWETTTNTFTTSDIASILTSFRLTSSAAAVGNNVSAV